MNDTELLNKLIEELIKKGICPDDIDLKDRADEFGDEGCKRKYCMGCWKTALKTLEK